MAASDPSAAQIKARDWLPEAMLFPAVDPDAREEEEAEQDALDEDGPEDGEAMDEAA